MPAGPAEPLRPAAQQRVVYLDAAQGECDTPENFRRTLVRTLLASQTFDRCTREGRELADLQAQLNAGAACPWETARAALTWMKPLHPVVCLDEFEALLTGAFDNRFFDALRSWANEGYLTWITASRQSLTRLGRANNLTSPFFNLLATIELQGFTAAEAEQLLDQANPTPYAFTAKERKLLRHLAGNHPYHLQIVGERAWVEKAHGRPVARPTLVAYLCRQEEAPALCQERPPLHTGWKVSLVLALAFVLAVALLTWRDPAFVLGVLNASWGGLQTILSYWDEAGDFAQRMSGLLWLLGIAGVIVVSLWQRRFGEVLRQLREKVGL